MRDHDQDLPTIPNIAGITSNFTTIIPIITATIPNITGRLPNYVAITPITTAPIPNITATSPNINNNNTIACLCIFLVYGCIPIEVLVGNVKQERPEARQYWCRKL
jgi:hypothetical protein